MTMTTLTTDPSLLTLEQKTLVAHEDRLLALERTIAMTDPTLPEVHANVQALTDAHADNATKIDQNSAQLNNWSSFLSTPVGKAVAGMILFMIPIFTVWITDHLKPAPAPVVIPATDAKPSPPVIVNVPPVVAPLPQPASTCLNPTGCKCGCVQTGNCVCPNCDHPMLTAAVKPLPDPIAPPIVKPSASGNTITIYTTAASDFKALLADPALKGLTVTVAAKQYPPGNVYPFNDKSIPVPCAALIDPAGKVLDVMPLPPSMTGAELAAWAAAKIK